MNNIVLYQSPLERYVSIIKADPYFAKQYIIDNEFDKALYSQYIIEYRSSCNQPITDHDIERYAKHKYKIDLMDTSPTLQHLTFNVNKARYNRSSKLTSEIQKMLSLFPCSFVTLTFKDDTLSKCSLDTLKKYVKRYLKSQSKYYIANIDYGRKNERVHFHAIVTNQEMDLDPWRKYGAINVEKIRLPIGCFEEVSARYQDETAKKIGKYISKLSNHAIKETAKVNYAIYSEGLKELNVLMYYHKLKTTDKAIKPGVELFGDALEIII